MEITKYCADYFSKINQNICSLDYHQLKEFIDLVLRLKLAGNKIIIVGNGGSAAIASHVAVDFTKAARIRTVNFNEASVLTCFANDYGYEHWVARALEAGIGCSIYLKKTHMNTLKLVPIETLKKFAIDLS